MTVKCGIIGCGGRGSSLMHHLLQDPRVDFNAVCDIDPEALDSAAKAVFNVKKIEPQKFENYQDLLDQADID